MSPARFACGLVIAAVVPAPATAAPPRPAHWAIQQQPPRKPFAPGSTFTVSLAAQIDPGWHLYALQEPEGGPLPTVIGLAENDPLTLLDVTEAEPRRLPDPQTHAVAGVFLGSASFTLKLRAPRPSPPAGAVSHVLVRYQTCNDQVCLPPHTESIDLPLAGLVR